MSMADDFVAEYRSCLKEDLTVNSKPVIDNLTTLAAENKESATRLSSTIEEHIRTCEAGSKLPALYLVDSISKNVGEPFLTLFSKFLPDVFCGVWKSASAELRKDLLKLYFTWKAVHPPSVLLEVDSRMRKLSEATQQASRPNPRPTGKPTKPSSSVATAVAPKLNPSRDSTARPAANGGAIASQTLAAGKSNGLVTAVRESGVERAEKKSSEAIGQVSDGTTVDVSTLVSLLLQTASARRKREGAQDGECVLDATELTPAVVKADNPRVLAALREGSHQAKPKFLDWRFQIRRDRRKKSYRTRRWYAEPERWILDSNPVDISPLELVEKLTEEKVIAKQKHIVLIDDDDPQTHCEISGDKLEKYFDEELEDWYYKDCQRVYGEEAEANGVRDGAIVIVSCLRKIGDARKDELLGLKPATSMARNQAVSKELARAAAEEAGGQETNRKKRMLESSSSPMHQANGGGPSEKKQKIKNESKNEVWMEGGTVS
ncbi:hypothetical protein BSKO_06145 [Bryopsis sp. KO-2023]|nr:hypothetical protein BSKO_06145 [Bryopsis sp. KO-2023]